MSVWKTVFDFIETNNITFGVVDRILTTLHLAVEWIGKMGEALAEDVAKYDALTCSYVSVTVSY